VRDTVDPLWLVIPAAVGIFLMRTLFIARRLKTAAANPTLADVRALRDAKRSLNAHREILDEAVASTKGHLEAAKRLAHPDARPGRPSRTARTADDAGPARRA
jgi:hypothetical protein